MKIGNIRIATTDDLHKMYDAALGILATVGMRVTHETVLSRLEAYGARVSRTDCIVRFPTKVVEKAVEAIRKAMGRRDLPSERPFDDAFHASLGDGCFFLHDFEKNTRRKATREDFIATVRFADALPEVSSFAAPVEIGRLPIETMVIEMQALCYLNSAKPSGVENNIPEQVKYLAELRKILRDYRPNIGADCNAQGVTSPLTFGDRAAELYIEGGKYDFNSGVYTMAIAGANAPATIEGCATQAAAEILGAWTCLMATDENRRVGSLILTGTIDMRTGKACWASPGAIRQNCLATTMFNEVLGVPMGLDWTWYTDAVVPGYQCALDRVMKMLAMAPQKCSTAFHLGDLDGASLFSLEQCILDLDVCRGVFELYRPAKMTDTRMAVPEIERIGAQHGKSHMETDFTLEHFRETLWMPTVIPHAYWKEGLTGVSETDVLQHAHSRVQDILARHEPYQAPAPMSKAIQKVLEKASAELL
ncbi:MAG: trimethylamine methyltransferase family protein [Planctomycetota bacterium]